MDFNSSFQKMETGSASSAPFKTARSVESTAPTAPVKFVKNASMDSVSVPLAKNVSGVLSLATHAQLPLDPTTAPPARLLCITRPPLKMEPVPRNWFPVVKQ